MSKMASLNRFQQVSYTVETQSLDTVSEEKCKIAFQGISLGLQQLRKTGLINAVFMILIKVKS